MSLETISIALVTPLGYALMRWTGSQMKKLIAVTLLWRYCEDSVRAIFGDVSGDEIADAIIRAIHVPPCTPFR